MQPHVCSAIYRFGAAAISQKTNKEAGLDGTVTSTLDFGVRASSNDAGDETCQPESSLRFEIPEAGQTNPSSESVIQSATTTHVPTLVGQSPTGLQPADGPVDRPSSHRDSATYYWAQQSLADGPVDRRELERSALSTLRI